MSLVRRPVCRAGPISVNVERSNFVDAILRRADLGKQILAHGAVLPVLDALLPGDRCPAGVKVRKDDAEGGVRVNLEAPKEAVVHVLAILDDGPPHGPRHPLDAVPEAISHEHGVRVNLDHPIVVHVLLLPVDRLPHLDERARVDPGPGGLPPRKVEFVVDVHHLLGEEACTQRHLLVAVDLIRIACKDANFPCKLLRQELLLSGRLARPTVDCADGEAEE
mmetsp:Transcript_110469/g.312367  ORF Transcript_110469/g.312367 Transcript_110469/m.312367 type:complete len:221 (-) Transcript_110469:557-1219(-)